MNQSNYHHPNYPTLLLLLYHWMSCVQFLFQLLPTYIYIAIIQEDRNQMLFWQCVVDDVLFSCCYNHQSPLLYHYNQPTTSHRHLYFSTALAFYNLCHYSVVCYTLSWVSYYLCFEARTFSNHTGLLLGSLFQRDAPVCVWECWASGMAVSCLISQQLHKWSQCLAGWLAVTLLPVLLLGLSNIKIQI